VDGFFLLFGVELQNFVGCLLGWVGESEDGGPRERIERRIEREKRREEKRREKG